MATGHLKRHHGLCSAADLRARATPRCLHLGRAVRAAARHIEYNSTHAGDYPQVLAPVLLGGLGLLVPPFRWLGVWNGTGSQAPRTPRHSPWPSSYSTAPSRQARALILPAVPFIVAAGSIGWHAFIGARGSGNAAQLHRGLVAVGLLLSVGAGIGLCFIQPKVPGDVMTALYDRGDLENFLIVRADGGAMPPQFYRFVEEILHERPQYRCSQPPTGQCNSPRYLSELHRFPGDRLLGRQCSGTNHLPFDGILAAVPPADGPLAR